MTAMAAAESASVVSVLLTDVTWMLTNCSRVNSGKELVVVGGRFVSCARPRPTSQMSRQRKRPPGSQLPGLIGAEASFISLRIQHLAHFVRQSSRRVGLGQKGHALIEHAMMGDGIIRVS